MISEVAILQNDDNSLHLVTPNSHAEKEKNLVSAARRGDSEAFEQLCQPCMSKIRRTAYRITRNREDAEDAVQDSLLRAFVNIRNFNGGSTFSTWLTRIVINSSLMIIRKRRNSPEISAVDEIGTEGNEKVWNIPDAGPSPEANFSRRERRQILLGVINAMRPTRRRVIELQHLQELSLKETAMALGVSVVVAKSRLFHARTALRKSSALKAIAKSRSECAA